MSTTVIEGPDSHLHLSAASSWDIAIKYAIRRVVLPERQAEYVP